MKWTAHWWGIELEAENDIDNAALRVLLDRLKPKPVDTYDSGELEVEEIEGLTKITFNR